jgi:protein-tyrosine phosphatase
MNAWTAFEATVVIVCFLGSATTVLWCVAVIIGSYVEAHQERAALRRRRRSYQVGGAISPEITRAWLSAMQRPRKDFQPKETTT